LLNTTGGNVTINLKPVIMEINRILTIKRTIAANTAYLQGNAAETVDDDNNPEIPAQYWAVTIHNDGTAWHIRSRA